MAKERQNVFWIKTGETFAGRKVGSDITDYFFDEDGKPLKDKDGKEYASDRLKQLKKDGYVSMVEPESYEDASEKELNQLRETVKSQTQKIVDLENDLETVPKNVTAARREIKALKAELVEKDIELEKITDPKRNK